MNNKNDEQKEILLNESLVAKENEVSHEHPSEPHSEEKDDLVLENHKATSDEAVEPVVENDAPILESEAIELDETADEALEDTVEVPVTEESDKTREMTPLRETSIKPEDSMNKKKKKNKRHWTTYVFVIIGVLVVVPSLIVGAIVIQASLGQGKPAEGERFNNDLEPAITEENIAQIKTAIEGLEHVETVEINLISATLRVNVKTQEEVSAENYAKLMQDLYNTVITTLPVDQYFKVQPEAGRHQYDLEINAYNLDPKSVNADTEGTLDAKYIYFALVKSSLMDTIKIQEVSVPVDAEQAEYLRQRVKEREEWLQQQESQEQNGTDGAADGEGA